MPNNNKKSSVQRDKIVATAEEMLTEEGYDNTSLNDIIHESGIAKGTFYHYFNSKNTLMDHLITKMSRHIMAPIRKITANPDLNAAQKFNAFINYGKHYKMTNKRFYRTLTRWLWREENIRFRHKIMNKNLKLMVPELTKIIEQGNKEKLFNVALPQEIAEMVFGLGLTMADSIAPVLVGPQPGSGDLEIIKKKFKAYEEAIEKLLGVKSGVLEIYDEEALLEMFKD